MLLSDVDDDGDDGIGGVPGAAHNRHDEGDERGQVGDLPGMPAQQHLGQMNQVVHGAGHLKRGNSADDRHDDADDIPGGIIDRRVNAGDGQDDDTSRAGEPNTDTAESGTDDDEEENDEEMEPDHGAPSCCQNEILP